MSGFALSDGTVVTVICAACGGDCKGHPWKCSYGHVHGIGADNPEDCADLVLLNVLRLTARRSRER